MFGFVLHSAEGRIIGKGVLQEPLGRKTKNSKGRVLGHL